VPCAGTSNADDRSRIKCDRRLSEAVQVTHQPPSSAGYLSGLAGEDMRCHARRPRRMSTFPYVNASASALVSFHTPTKHTTCRFFGYTSPRPTQGVHPGRLGSLPVASEVARTTWRRFQIDFKSSASCTALGDSPRCISAFSHA
jgi:hypothetical protein